MKRIRNKTNAWLLICALVCCLFSTAVLADTGYSGYLDPETGEPAEDDTSDSGRVELSDTMYYDWDSHDYVYPINSNLGDLHCSVADGMIVTSPVSVSTGVSTVITVYKDGEVYNGSYSGISDPGEYVVQADVDGQKKQILSFTILGELVSSLSSFIVPDGFYVTEATRNGEPIYTDRYSVSLAEEGTYRITYESYATDLSYTLTTTIDRTGPELIFEGRTDKQGRYHSAVTYSKILEGDYVVLFRDGVEVTPSIAPDGTGTILDSGNYILDAYDAAGNMTEYTFTIMVYFNVNSVIFIILVLLVIAGVLAYIFFKRERLKIG